MFRKELRTSVAVVILVFSVACGGLVVQDSSEAINVERTIGIQESPMRVSASLETVQVKELNDPGRNEIYVVAMAADNMAMERREDNATDVSAGQFRWVSSLSVVFKGIKNNEEISLSGDGIILYPNRNPKGALGICFSIVEQDKRQGSNLKAAQFLENIGESLTNNINVDVSNLLISATESIIRYYKKDDILFTHCHSGFSHNSYGIEGSETTRTKTQSIELDKERVKVVLKLTIIS